MNKNSLNGAWVVHRFNSDKVKSLYLKGNIVIENKIPNSIDACS